MEFVVFTGVLLFIFLFMIVQELMQAKKEEKIFRNSLLEDYGKEPPKEYSLDIVSGRRGIPVFYPPEYLLREGKAGPFGGSDRMVFGAG